jgi:hypothetical protein
VSVNDELMKDGRGRVIRIDGSIDKFSTVAYRWGEAAGALDGTNDYNARILSVAPVRRSLGEQRVATASTCTVVLDNADGGLDALAGQASLPTQSRLRLRIYVALYDPAASPLVFASKLLGEFSLAQWIRRDNTTLTLSLADDVMGAVSQQATLPNFLDWHNVGGSAATNPLYDAFSLPDSETEYTSLQLAFGEDWVLAHPHVLPHGTVDAAYQGKVIIPICCTRSTDAVSATEITALRISWLNWDTGSVELRDVPTTAVENVVGGAATSRNVWTIERSPTITKDGKTFKIIYLVVRSDLGCFEIMNNWLTGQKAIPGGTGGFHPQPQFEGLGNYGFGGIAAQRAWASNDPERPQYAYFAAGVLAWYVKGVPLSARTQTTTAIQHPVDVLTDLVSYYSNNTGITLDTAQMARVKVATRIAACAGTVQPWMTGPKRGDPVFVPPPSLRQTITAICQSSDIDAFINWSGEFSLSTDFWDFTIATSGTASWTPDAAYQTSGNGTTTQYIPAVIPETWLQDGVEEWVPSEGERWAPYNRLWFNGAKASPGDGIQSVPFQGPWDFDNWDTSITLSYRIVEATLEQGWRPFRQQAIAPAYWRQLNSVARTMVRFRTHIGGLMLEIGQYFALSWTRGPTLGGPYSGTIFQCEAITYAPGDDSVEVTAVWRQDVMTERQYLLDDETMIVRSKGGLSGSATPDGAGTVNFGGTINLTTMGVVAGDILVLRDTSQAADVFTLNAAFRIGTVSATSLDCAAGTPPVGTVVDADWSIQRGATTYHTAVSDPTNYPLGGEMYGKTTDASGATSDSAEGNRLISG